MNFFYLILRSYLPVYTISEMVTESFPQVTTLSLVNNTSTSTSHSLLQQEKNPSKISVSFFSEYVFYVVSGFLEVFFRGYRKELQSRFADFMEQGKQFSIKQNIQNPSVSTLYNVPYIVQKILVS
jgi:hypothetical protein